MLLRPPRLLAQSAPMTLTSPRGFPIDHLMEVLFRAMHISSTEAAALRRTYAGTTGSMFFPIPRRYEMDIRQMQLKSGSGLLVQNAAKGGELAFLWSTGDRTYFLFGLMSENDAVATANALN